MVLKISIFKQFQMTKSDEDKDKCGEVNRKAVRIAKAVAYGDLCAKLDSREGIKVVYKLAKTRDRRPTISQICLSPTDWKVK